MPSYLHMPILQCSSWRIAAKDSFGSHDLSSAYAAGPCINILVLCHSGGVADSDLIHAYNNNARIALSLPSAAVSRSSMRVHRTVWHSHQSPSHD